MAKKKNKRGPVVIKGKEGTLMASLDYSFLSYHKGDIILSMHMYDDEVVFKFIFDKMGIALDYRIEGEKEVKAFVDFVNKTYERLTQPRKKLK